MSATAVIERDPVTQTNLLATRETKTPATAVPAEPGKTPDRFRTIRLVDSLGLEITIQVRDLEDAYAVRRAYGKKGFNNPGEIPVGGYRQPYSMHDKFDWSLIGAHKGRGLDSKGVEVDGVWYRDQFYAQRVPTINEKKNLGEAIWYSRGARASEQTETEAASNNAVYIRLITFKGKGRENPIFKLPPNP